MFLYVSFEDDILLLHSFYILEPKYFSFLKWQYRTGARAGAKNKGESGSGAGAEVKSFLAPQHWLKTCRRTKPFYHHVPSLLSNSYF